MVDDPILPVIDFDTAFRSKDQIEIENIKDIEVIFVPYYVAGILERRGMELAEIQLNGDKVENILATQDIKDMISANTIGNSILRIRNTHSDTTLPPIQYLPDIRLEDIFTGISTIGGEIKDFINTLTENKFEFNMSNIDLLRTTYEFKLCNDVVYVILKENFFNGMRFGLQKFRIEIIRGILNYLFSQLPNDRVFKSRIFKEAIQFFN